MRSTIIVNLGQLEYAVNMNITKILITFCEIFQLSFKYMISSSSENTAMQATAGCCEDNHGANNTIVDRPAKYNLPIETSKRGKTLKHN